MAALGLCTIHRQIDITTYQIRKIKADTSLCLFADEFKGECIIQSIVQWQCFGLNEPCATDTLLFLAQVIFHVVHIFMQCALFHIFKF